MDKEFKDRYYELFEQMVSEMTTIPIFDRDRIVRVNEEICKLFRLSKSETRFYRSINHERIDDGEIICDYDNGTSARIAVQRRIFTRSGTVLICSVYQAEEDSLTEEEEEKIDIMLRAMMSFIGRNRLQDALEQLGFYDEFGYPNFRYYNRFMNNLFAANHLYGHTIACYNLRRFSLVNQQLGREMGDIVMRKYYNLIKNTIGEDGCVGRLGGDNYVCVFPNDRTKSVLELFDGIPILYDPEVGNRIRVSACAGIYVIPEKLKIKSPEQLMDKIFPTMTIAKQENHGTILYYDEKMVQMRDHVMHIRSIFPNAMKNREFHAFYQPKVDVTWGTIVGAEALCRWFHDDKIVPPMEFIPVLEQNSDICQLDYYMLETACRDIRRWIDSGKKPVRISTNFSRKNLTNVDFLENILEIINRYEIPHEYIEIELTETTTDAGFRDLKRVVTGLREAGVATSIDDFGMGFSSLNLLQDMPWTVLKIDRSFLPNDEEDLRSKNHVMYGHVVSLARDIGLQCVTEGVETAKQIQLLRKNHCHIAQGYFFDKPLPVEEFEKRLDTGKYDVSRIFEPKNENHEQ